MRVSTHQMFQQRVAAMLDQQARLSRTELQLATGERFTSAAEDPAAALRKLQLTDRIAQTQQFQKNADAAISRLSIEEGALADAGNVLQRVRELSIQSINGSLAPSDLAAIAVEVRENLDAMLGVGNRQDANGDFMFAGYKTGGEAFTHDGSGNFTYNGDQGSHSLQIGANRKIQVSDHGQAIFYGIPATAGGLTSAFDILYDFAEALDAGTPSADTISDIDAALDKVLTARSDVGSRMRTVENQRDINESFTLILEQDRGALADLDYAEAVARFNQQLLAFQASQQVFTKIQDLTLFNYIS